MRYADNRCTYSETSNPHKYIFKGKCISCKKEQTVSVQGPELFKYRQGEYIQNALTNSASEREFLMSGICGDCFKAMATEDED